MLLPFSPLGLVPSCSFSLGSPAFLDVFWTLTPRSRPASGQQGESSDLYIPDFCATAKDMIPISSHSWKFSFFPRLLWTCLFSSVRVDCHLTNRSLLDNPTFPGLDFLYHRRTGWTPWLHHNLWKPRHLLMFCPCMERCSRRRPSDVNVLLLWISIQDPVLVTVVATLVILTSKLNSCLERCYQICLPRAYSASVRITPPDAGKRIGLSYPALQASSACHKIKDNPHLGPATSPPLAAAGTRRQACSLLLCPGTAVGSCHF